MKRAIFSMLLIALMTMALGSCSTKQRAINQLESFSYELRDNGRYYTFRDWERAAERFSEIRKNLNKHDYTGDQRHRIGELEGQCAGYVYEGIKGRLQDFGYEINGILEGLLDIIDMRF